MASEESIQRLRAFPKGKDFFLGVDSDGCAFDTMEIKQSECFIPNTICHYGLQAISRYVRQTEAWVSLHSRWRGANRFPALVRVLDLLARQPECVARGYRVPPLGPLRQWIAQESQLGNPALEAKVAETADPVLARALAWSKDVNAAVERIVQGVPPFPLVRECLQEIARQADVMVVSATPEEALVREWREHGLDRYAGMICGQELGTKAEQLRHGAAGKYPPGRILMIGDAEGDLEAARASGALFYPINPGREEASWKRFRDEAAGRFFAGEYDGDYQRKLIDDFLGHLPSEPPWETI